MASVQGGNFFPQDEELRDEELEQREAEELIGGSGARGAEEDVTEGGRDTNKGKKRKKRSPAWFGYTCLEPGDGDPPVAKRKGKCNRCGNLIAADPETNGTSGLRKHTLACNAKHEVKDGQTKLVMKGGVGESSCTLTTWKFDQQEARLKLCEMIILDELPFKFVEKEGFRTFLARVCPDFHIPSRQTIREDCVKLFVERKETLKAFFKKKGMGKVSITTDCWTAINNTNFICVTAHSIGADWILHKKIIGFRKIIGHKGEDIGAAVVDVLNGWDMKNILCCTVDNASANDVAVRYLGRSLDTWNTGMLGGKYVHMRCVAHIINLVVSDGLEEIGVSVRRVREAVKWVKSSPMRTHGFYKCSSNFIGTDGKGLSLDVPTRWNSTYLMLESVVPYDVAFKVYASVNSGFVNDMYAKKYNDSPLGPPTESDWVNVKKMMEYLKTFYNFTLLFSGTTYVTSHMFFKEMTAIFEKISTLEMNIDSEIRSMARKMKEKIGKYWLETEDLNPKMNKLFYIAAILDPRQKLDHVETCLHQVYGESRATMLMTHIKEVMHEVFDYYKRKQMTSTPAASASRSPSQCQLPSSINTLQGQQSRSRPRGSARIIPKRTQSRADDFSEMDIYFSEPQYIDENESQETIGNDVCDEVDDGGFDTFDILGWWSKDGARYRVLSEMARDILAIPISTVASESAFSMGSRVLDQFRSSLNPEMVEALICSSDWLRSSPAFMLDEEEAPEEEQAEQFQTGMYVVKFFISLSSYS